MLRIIATLLLMTGSVFCQEAELVQARAFVRGLTGDTAIDDVRLHSLPREEVQALLTKVYAQGMSQQATLEDWSDLHRALNGLVRLFSSEANPTSIYQASIYSNLNDGAYREHERDYPRALASAEQSLEFVQRSGITGTLFLSWDNIGRDLLNVGRITDAVTAFHTAIEKIPADQMYSRSTASLWRDVIDGELAHRDLEAAKHEAERFGEIAAGGPAYFRAQSQLTIASVEIAAGDYSQVTDHVRRGWDYLSNREELAAFRLDAILLLLDCVLDSTNRLPYPEAVTLASRLEKDVPDLAFPIVQFARQSIRSRRRIAGEIGAILREDSLNLDEATRVANAESQIDALRLVASDYAYAGSVSNQIAALERAANLTASRQTPVGYPATYALARLLVDLGEAYTSARPFGPTERARADEVLSVAASAIDRQAAPDRERLASLRGQVELNRAEVFRLRGQTSAARSILNSAAEDSTTMRFDRADVFLRLARLDRDSSLDAAVIAYDRAITQFDTERRVLEKVAAQIESSRSLALKGRWDLARSHLDQVQVPAGFADADWKLPYVDALISQATGQPQLAAKSFRQAITSLESTRARLGLEERRGFTDSEWVTDLYQQFTGLLIAMGEGEEAWRNVQRAKARTFLDSLTGREFQPATTPQMAEAERRIVGLRLELSPSSASLMGSLRNDGLVRTELAEQEKQFTLMHDRARLQQGSTGELVSPEPQSLASVQSKLSSLKGTALIDYAFTPEGLAVFVISRSSFTYLTWQIDRTSLDEDVLTLRGILASPTPNPDLPRLLASVSERIWHPVAAKLPPGTRNLILSPALSLNYLPFQVLPDARRQLIDRYVISYVPSSSVVSVLESTASIGKSIFLGAIGSIQAEGAPPLPGTTAEVEAIAKLYRNPMLATEKEFSHDRVLRAIAENDIVHLATHGIYDAQAPAFTALLTSPAQDQASRVSLYELANSKVHAQLVILSACDSAVGRLYRGDEISSLTRTLLASGARSVVSSLWEVDDKSTAQLMRLFHSAIQAGHPPAEALRLAALEVRKRYPNPMYWAPFLVTGF